MADKKITQLTNITGANLVDADEFVVVDISADETKAITLGELKEAFDSGSGFVRITGDTMTGDLTVPNVIVSGNVDGRDVSADGTKLDGIEAGADVTDTANVTAAGAAMETGAAFTGDVTFGDNDKAIFGAGSDLQIYHDGSNSYISDQGTGNIILDANDSFQVKRGANTSAVFDTNAEVALYHNNSPKLATTSTGINVTGTVTADGLTVNGATVLDIGDEGTLQVGPTTTGADENQTFEMRGSNGSNELQRFQIANRGDNGTVDFKYGRAGATPTKAISIGSGTGDISFYEDTGTTPKFFWDASAERLGLGTTNAAAILHLTRSSDTADIKLESSGGSGRIYTIQSRTDGNFSIVDSTAGGVQRVTMDSSGNVGIGTSSPSYKMTINTPDEDHLRLENGSELGFIRVMDTGALDFMVHGENSTDVMTFRNGTGTGTERMRIDSSGNVGIGTSSPATQASVQNASTSLGLEIDTTSGFASGPTLRGYYRAGSAYKPIAMTGSSVHFGINDVEKMRIDSSGNVGIGTSSPDYQLQIENSGEANLSIKSGVSNYAQILLGDSGNAALGRLRYNNADNSFQTVVNGGVATTIDSSGNVGIGTSSPATDAALTVAAPEAPNIFFQRSNSGRYDAAIGMPSGADLAFYNGADSSTVSGLSERMRIDPSGNLLVGKTATDLTADGIELRGASEAITVTTGSNISMYLNRRTTDGDIVQFRKDNTTVGSIGTSGGDVYISTGTNAGVRFNDGVGALTPASGTANADNAVNLGYSTVRWKDLYLSGGVYLGGTGSANKLDDYEEGTWTPTLPNGGTVNSIQNATYTKVGRLVTAYFYVRITPTNDSIQFKIGGLPYTAITTGFYGCGHSISYSNTFDVSNWGAPLVLTNGDFIYFHYVDGSTSNSVMNSAFGGTEKELIAGITYFTT